MKAQLDILAPKVKQKQQRNDDNLISDGSAVFYV